MGACNPIGCCARIMGNPTVTSAINLLLDLCSLAILLFAAYQNFSSVSKCFESYEQAAGTLGRYYGKWIWAGGLISAILSVFTIIETASDTILDFCCDTDDENDPGCNSSLACCMRWLKTVKKYYMMLTNAGEPIFLLSLTAAAKVAAVFTSVSEVMSEDELKAAKSCVDDRYQVIASTGIGAILASIQTTVRLYLDVGKYVQKEIEGAQGDTVEHYRNAYARASSAFGPVGGALILIGYSDDIADMELVAKSIDMPEELKDLMEERIDAWE